MSMDTMEDYEKPSSNLSKSMKRRLRRIRRANMPAIVSEPKPDEPRISKSAKRRLRLQKKMALLHSSMVSSDMKHKKDEVDNVNNLDNASEKEKYITLAKCKVELPEKDLKPKSKEIKNTSSKLKSEAVDWKLIKKEEVFGDDVPEPVDNESSVLVTNKPGAKCIKKEDTSVEVNGKRPNSKVPARYVLFVGNLPYMLTKDSLAAHFNKTDHPPTHIRLIMQEKSETLNKGFAYVEFGSEEGYLNALKLHHSFLEQRRINVEYSTGTKGKNAKSKTFIKKKDLKLKAIFSKHNKKK